MSSLRIVFRSIVTVELYHKQVSFGSNAKIPLANHLAIQSTDIKDRITNIPVTPRC